MLPVSYLSAISSNNTFVSNSSLLTYPMSSKISSWYLFNFAIASGKK